MFFFHNKHNKKLMLDWFCGLPGCRANRRKRDGSYSAFCFSNHAVEFGEFEKLYAVQFTLCVLCRLELLLISRLQTESISESFLFRAPRESKKQW